MPVLSDGAAPRGIELPNASGRYLATLMGLGLVVGLAVIAYNCYQERARALLLRGRPVLRRPEVVVTNVVALILMANALLCGLAPMHQARIDVPTSLGITSHKVRMVGKAEAVAVAVLAQAALTVNSLYTWLIYRLGCHLSNIPLPRWKVALIHAYIWGIDTLPFLSYSVYYQIKMRTSLFHVVPDSNAAFSWLMLAFTVASFVVHVVLHVLMVFRFIQGLKALAQHARVLKNERMAELQALSVKAVVYIALSLVLYIFIFTCFLVYPINVYLNMVTTPFHLLLLLAIHLCFNTKLPLASSSPANTPPRRPKQPQEPQIAQQTGQCVVQEGSVEGGGEIEEGKEEGQGPRGWSSSPLSPGGPTRWRRQRQRQQQLPQEEEEEGKHEMSSGHVGVAVAVGPMSPPNVHEGFPFAGSQRRQQTGNNHGWGRRLFGPVGAVEESSGGGDRDREVVFSLSEAIPFSASNNSNTRSDSVSLLHLASGGVARGESHSFPHTHRTCSARPTQSLSMGASVSCRSGRDVRVSSTGLPNVVGRLAGGLFSPSSGSGIDLEGDGRGDGGVVEEAAVLSSLLSPRTAAASLGL